MTFYGWIPGVYVIENVLFRFFFFCFVFFFAFLMSWCIPGRLGVISDRGRLWAPVHNHSLNLGTTLPLKVQNYICK